MLALAGMFRAAGRPAFWTVGLILVAILALNSTMSGLGFVALGALLFVLDNSPRTLPVLSVGLIAVLAVFFPPVPVPPLLPEPSREALERIRAETPPDALFVIPVALSEFRHFAQRSAYVDFKLFSVAQPDQAALTRARMEEVAQPIPSHRAERGWKAARLWEIDQRNTATCSGMAETLAATGADYYLRSVDKNESPPDCPALQRPILTETLAVYGPSG
jgi:hypothetical protein